MCCRATVGPSRKGFHSVVCMYPTRRNGTDKAYLTSEILSFVTDYGIAIIGARNGYWRSDEAMEFLQGFEGDGFELRSFQEVKLSENDYKRGYPVDSEGNEPDTAPGGSKDTYWLAMLKRSKLADPNFKPKISKYK